MQRVTILLLVLGVVSSAWGLSTPTTTTPASALQTPATFSTRRHALNSLVGFGGATISLFGQPALAAAAKEGEEETVEEKKKRLLKERIAASKTNFRKADSYAQERFTTVDNSCIADTGAPCKQPKSVFPSDEQIALDGKIEDLWEMRDYKK